MEKYISILVSLSVRFPLLLFAFTYFSDDQIGVLSA